MHRAIFPVFIGMNMVLFLRFSLFLISTCEIYTAILCEFCSGDLINISTEIFTWDPFRCQISDS